MYLKLVEKCPLFNPVVKGASALSSRIMLNAELRENRFKTLMKTLVMSSVIEGSGAGGLKQEYLDLCAVSVVIEYLKKYTMNQRLDEFLFGINEFFPISKRLEDFFKCIFIIFPTNAEVERRFSTNEECLVDNLQNDSLIAQRSVYDHVKMECDLKIENVVLSTSLRQHFLMHLQSDKNI